MSSYGDWMRHFQLSGIAKSIKALVTQAATSAESAMQSASSATQSASDARTAAADAEATAKLVSQAVNPQPSSGLSLDAVESLKGVDSILVTGFNEFDYDTIVQQDNGGNTINAALDQYVNGKSVPQCQANFPYMVQQDLAPVVDVDTVLLWAQWFSPCAHTTGADAGAVAPAINGNMLARLNADQWSCGGVGQASAMVLTIPNGGSPNDESLLRGARYLLARGYKVGFAPIVIGIVNTVGLSSSQSLVWRGYFNWSTTENFQTWLTSYTAFVQYYCNLFYKAGVPLSRCVLGSEFSAFVTGATSAQWALFVPAMQALAKIVKGLFPQCVVTYAANYTDYGVGSSFRLDSLWSHPSIDEVGIDWYFPITSKATRSAQDILAGLRAGEGLDYTVNPSDATQRTLTGSAGVGKTLLAQTAITSAAGIKNVIGFYSGQHYVTKQAGSMAEATPLPGFDRDYNPGGLGIMTGTASPVLAAGYSQLSSGVQPVIPDTATWLETDGVSKYGVFAAPTYSLTQNAYTLHLKWKLSAIPPENYSRLLECGGFLEVYADTSAGGGIKLNVGSGSNQMSYVLCAVDTIAHTAEVTVQLTGSLGVTVTIDGIRQQYGLSAAAAVAIPSAASIYVGGYNTNSNLIAASFYQLGLTLSMSDGSVCGGVFNFEEAYAGVRTAWTAASKPISATEVGFASMAGTSVEPSQFPYADVGVPALALPSGLDASTVVLLSAFMAKGWSPTQLYGPYGSTFAIDEVEQYLALKETLALMSELKRRGVMSNATLYCLDARPAASFLALTSGSVYYVDAPTFYLGHAVNGKIAGGNTKRWSNIVATGNPFNAS